MSDFKIFYLSSIPYDFMTQRPQRLFRATNNRFGDKYEFFYVEYPNLVSYLKKRLLNNYKNNKIITLPFIIQFKLLANFAYNLFNNINITKYFNNNSKIRIAVVASPFWEPHVLIDEFDIICYDYMDSIKVYDDKNYANIKKKHERLISKADLIFTTAEKLKEEIQSISPQTDVVMVSNGVDIDFFENKKEIYEIKDYYKNKIKVIGYIGAIYNWIDLDLIYKSANILTDADFILIGPISGENKKFLRKKPNNVFFLGEKEYDKIPSYLNMFDVAIIPFKNSEISESTDPIKVYEYFALGKPVVSTYLRQLKKYDDGKLLKMSTNSNDFIESISFFLNNDSRDYCEKRKMIARENSWSKKAKLIINAIKKEI